MGNQRKNSKGNRGFRSKAERAAKAQEWKSTTGGDPRRQNWGDMVMTNDRFDAFYKACNFVAEGDEFESFLQHLRNPLPACFRINSDYDFRKQLAAELQTYAGQAITLEDGTVVAPVKQMHWYPEGLAYKMGTDRRSLRKDERLDAMHKWMMRNTESGNITRQEAVSMVPPLALDVQSHHKCLDMCAAPGSKTSQLLEFVNPKRFDQDSGLVVANDSDTDRAYMLVHQCRRINSPSLIITTHKGQALPKIRNPDAAGAVDTSITDGGDFFLKNGYFDRVLADVPCSGDGTLRKNPSIWSKWSLNSSTSLHPLQILIATRGVQLLKVGGLITFSTCSMSPYEDEACVAELLRQADGALELVDAREFIPNFKARPGLSSWPVMDDKNASLKARKQREYQEKCQRLEAEALARGEEPKLPEGADAEEAAKYAARAEKAAAAAAAEPKTEKVTSSDPAVQACIDMGFDLYESYDDVPGNLKYKLRKSLFPPTKEEAKWMHLERCLRCVPHDEDTGGFFVATLRKVKPLNGKMEKPSKVKEDGAANDAVAVNEEDAVAVKEEDAVAVKEEDAVAVKEEGEEHASKRRAIGEERSAETTATSAAQTGTQELKECADTALTADKGFVDYAMWDKKSYDATRDFYGLNEQALPREAFYVRLDGAGSGRGKGGQGTTSRGVFYLPPAARQLLSNSDLKVVSAGLKIFEKKKDAGKGRNDTSTTEDPTSDYKLCQEGVGLLARHCGKRVVGVTAQDMCNLLEGGLVSFSTLADETVKELQTLSRGPVVCTYRYTPSDVCDDQTPVVGLDAKNVQQVCCIGSVGSTRAMNVLCAKVEADRLRHALQSLNVFRSKIKSDKVVTEEQPAAAVVPANKGGFLASIGSALHNAADAVSHVAHDAADAVSHVAHDAVDAVSHVAHDAADAVSHVAHDAAEVMHLTSSSSGADTSADATTVEKK